MFIDNRSLKMKEEEDLDIPSVPPICSAIFTISEPPTRPMRDFFLNS